MKERTDMIRLAISEAGKADWPFGAVVVCDGVIVGQAGAGSQVADPTAHAEVNAIRKACENLNTGALSGAILYASCEPCAMCFGAAWYAGIRNIVFGNNLDDIRHIDQAWGGDLGFPHDHLPETGVTMEGGMLKEEVMAMYARHPRTKDAMVRV